MSRTYRTHLDWASRAYGRDWTYEEEQEFFAAWVKEHGLKNKWYFRMGWNGHYFINRRARDKKAWDKPPRWFKAANRRWERSKVNHAIRIGEDPPIFRKSDRWEWT